MIEGRRSGLPSVFLVHLSVRGIGHIADFFGHFFRNLPPSLLGADLNPYVPPPGQMADRHLQRPH